MMDQMLLNDTETLEEGKDAEKQWKADPSKEVNNSSSDDQTSTLHRPNAFKSSQHMNSDSHLNE